MDEEGELRWKRSQPNFCQFDVVERYGVYLRTNKMVNDPEPWAELMRAEETSVQRVGATDAGRAHEEKTVVAAADIIGPVERSAGRTWLQHQTGKNMAGSKWQNDVDKKWMRT